MAGRTLSQYEILDQLAEGATGAVYRARDTQLDRTVAIKILREEVPQAKASAGLKHPNITTVYEIGEADGIRFLVMEYVEGRTLDAYINGRALPPAEILGLAVPLADALDEAHSRGITHGNLRASKIMVNARGQIKILNFGRVADVRDDVYALGVLIDEMARGSSRWPELERIKRKCLEMQPERRYQSARDLLVDLRNLERDSESQARQPARHVRRSWVLTAAAAVALLALAGFAAYRYLRPASIQSLAVLPFANPGGDANLEYLADGITESLINSVSHLRGLTVMSRSAVFRYKGPNIDPEETGRKLHVQAVLTGRVLQRANDFSISAELVDVNNSRHIWGQQYNFRFEDVFATQEEISREIAENLRLRFGSEERKQLAKRDTQNAEAYQLYLKGKFHSAKRTHEDLKKAITYFEQAIDKDPAYALAYAGLADTYILQSGALPPKDAYAKAKEAVMKSLELDETLPQAHGTLAYIKLSFDWDLPGAEREYQRTLELNPNYAPAHQGYSLYLSAMRRPDFAIAEIKRALQLDPLSLVFNTYLGITYRFARRFDEAIEQFRKTLEMDPNFATAHFFLGSAYNDKSMPREAIAEFQTGLKSSPADSGAIAGLGYAYAGAGDRSNATKVLDRLRELAKTRYVSPYFFALVYTGLGDRDRALTELEQGYRDRTSFMVFLNAEPSFDALHADPRFGELIKRVGLVQ